MYPCMRARPAPRGSSVPRAARATIVIRVPRGCGPCANCGVRDRTGDPAVNRLNTGY